MRRAALSLIAVLAPTAHAAQPQPGLYETTLQIVMKGMPMAMPQMHFKHCLTAEDIASGRAYRPSEDPEACKLGGLTVRGSAVSYDFQCKQDGIEMRGRATGTSAATSYEMLMVGTFVPPMQGISEFRQTLKARRLGACKKP